MRTPAEVNAAEVWHFDSPVDAQGLFETLLDGLLAAKGEYLSARWLHDHARAEAAMAEARELTALCAAMTEGRSDARARFIGAGAGWPLMPAPELDRL